MGARCVFAKNKNKSRERGEITMHWCCVHRCVVRLCVLQSKAHDLVHTSGHDRQSTAVGKVVGRNRPGITAPLRPPQVPALQLIAQQCL